jgi:hypothetical protein
MTSNSQVAQQSTLETDAPNLSKHDLNWHPFTVKPLKANGLYVLSSSVDRSNEPRRICYLFNGMFINNNEAIYSKATVTIKLFFELENGRTISDNEMDDNFLGGTQALKVIGQWKPKEQINVHHLISRGIPVAYIDYPIKKVYIRFYIETEDQINNENADGIIAEDDLTDKWKKTIQKVKSNIVDDNDYNFPKKIVGNEGLY